MLEKIKHFFKYLQVYVFVNRTTLTAIYDMLLH